MSERKKELLWVGMILTIILLYFSRILFTDMIIRAPDITSEFFWTIKHFKEMKFLQLFTPHLQAGWDMLANGGGTEGGGTVSLQLLFYRNLIFWLFPEPVNVAWFLVFHLFFGAAGTYFFCRVIGIGRAGAFLGGLIFAIAPENASLINAGHVQKIATISFAPWAFYFFEKTLLSRKVIYSLATGFILAIQFFNMHWQIAFYTCLALGIYAVARTITILISERSNKRSRGIRLVCLNLIVLFFFLSTVAISLLPLADWSTETTRGVQSGSNQGKGGLNVDEAMSWSMPPEEVATFIVPGMFGFSRQEGGYNTADIKAYYWGRMFFTQTTDYMGLLPWLLMPLALIFRRDKYTHLALAGLVLGILFSMGKYTPFYWFIYEHFPGINHFRVPKMMMFIPVMCLGVLAAKGFEAILEKETRNHDHFRYYLYGLSTLPICLLISCIIFNFGKGYFTAEMAEMLSQPTRYEQGIQLIFQRWNNLTRETVIAFSIALVHVAAVLLFTRRWISAKYLPALLIILFLLDTWRVNDKYMILQSMPQQLAGTKSPAMEFISKSPNQYRTLVMNNSDPMQFVAHGIPVMYTSNPVQMQRWQDFLDIYSLNSPMPDIMNVKYIVISAEQYHLESNNLNKKYAPAFHDTKNNEIVLENRSVLPKAWMVPSVFTVKQPGDILKFFQDPNYNPQQLAFTETQPPIQLKPFENLSQTVSVGTAMVNRYEANKIDISTNTSSNALLVLGEKDNKGWHATVDGKAAEIQRVNYILRGVYLTPGRHTVEFVFDPLPFRIGKYLTLGSFALFSIMLLRELLLARGKLRSADEG